MKIIIVGSGMYVTGRNNTGTGTILASLLETSKSVGIEKIKIVSRKKASAKGVEAAQKRINKLLGTRIKLDFQALGNNGEKAFEKILSKESFDACIVSTPDHLHFSYTKMAIEKGLHCLVVKPLTPTAKENKELIRLQKKHGVYGAVEFHKRWDETNMYIQRRIKEKAFGKLLYAVVEYSQKVSIPTETFRSWSGLTNIFQYLGVHYVDLMYFLTGFIPDRVNAYGTSGILHKKGIDTFDSVHVTLVWKNPKNPKEEFLVNYNTNWIDPECTTAMSDQKYMLIGTDGRINCNQKNRGLEEVTSKEGVKSVNPYFSDYLPDDHGNRTFQGYGHKSIEAFVKDVNNLLENKTTIAQLEKIRPTFTSSLISTAVLEAVNKSLEKNAKWVKVGV